MERTDDMFAYSCQYKVGENKLAEGERLNKVAVAKAIPYALPSYQRYVANAVLPISQNPSRLTKKKEKYYDMLLTAHIKKKEKLFPSHSFSSEIFRFRA